MDLLLGPFFEQNFKILFEQIQSYDGTSFLNQNWPDSQNEDLFEKTITITLIYILASLIVQNVKKTLRVVIMCQRWPICPKEIFLGKTINIIFYISGPFIAENF